MFNRICFNDINHINLNMEITIKLTQEQLTSIHDQQAIELGLPTIDETIKFKSECDKIIKEIKKFKTQTNEDRI